MQHETSFSVLIEDEYPGFNLHDPNLKFDYDSQHLFGYFADHFNFMTAIVVNFLGYLNVGLLINHD